MPYDQFGNWVDEVNDYLDKHENATDQELFKKFPQLDGKRKAIITARAYGMDKKDGVKQSDLNSRYPEFAEWTKPDPAEPATPPPDQSFVPAQPKNILTQGQASIPQPTQQSVSINPKTKPFTNYENAIQGYSNVQKTIHGLVNGDMNTALSTAPAGTTGLPGMQESQDNQQANLPALQQNAKNLKEQLNQHQKNAAGTMADIENEFVNSKDFNSFITHDGVLDYGKIHDYSLNKSREFGGDRGVGEILYNQLQQAAKMKQLQPKIDAEFKTLTGTTPDQYGQSEKDKQSAKIEALKTQYKTNFDGEIARSQNLLNTKASSRWKSYYQPYLEEMLKTTDQNDPQFKLALDNAKSQFAHDLRTEQSKENARILRVRDEMFKNLQNQAESTTKSNYTDLYNQAYANAVKNDKPLNSDLLDKPLTSGSPLALFVKSLYSGLNSWSATRGAGLVAAGYNNPITDWMRGRQTAAEQNDVPDLDLNLKNALNPQTYATRIGKMTGGMIPDIAATMALKNPMVGGLEFWGSSTVSGMGEVYNQAKSEGKSEEIAQSRARDFATNNVASLPGYLVMSAAIGEGLKGARNFAKNATQQVVGGLSSSLPQQYIQQSEGENAKTGSEFLLEDAPKSAIENIIGLAGGAAILHPIGKISKAMAEHKSNTANQQFYSNIIDKGGVNLAYASLENEFLNGKLNAEQLAAAKQQIDQMVRIKSGLESLGTMQDGHKLYIQNRLEIKDLQAKADAAPDETMKKVFTDQIKEKEKEAQDIIANKAPYLKLTTREGLDFVIPIDKAASVLDEMGDSISDGSVKAVSYGDKNTQKIIDNIKSKENAIQEQSAGEVLQREPGEIGETGGERGGVESGKQGKEAAEPDFRSQEEIDRLMNQELTSPKQKVKVKLIDPDTGEASEVSMNADKAKASLRKQHLLLDQILKCL